MMDKLRDLWYGVAARQTVRKINQPRKSARAKQDMQHVTGIVETVREFKVLRLRGSGAYPVYIKVRYTVDYAVYCKWEVFLSTGEAPCEGARLTVVYPKDNPRGGMLIF